MGFLEQAAKGYTSNKFVDPAKAMGGNFIQQMYKDVAAKNNAKRQKEAAVKNKVTNYIDKIDTTVDSNGLNDVMKSKTNNVLSNVRMELVDVINQLSNMEPNTEEYIQLNDRRNQLMEVPKKMQASIENYNKRKAEYLDDVDSDRISIADADNNEFASKIYTDEADFNWNPDGTISFVDNGKIIPFSDIKDPSLKAYDLADTILKDTYNYQKKGAQMSPEEESMKRNELNKLFDANPMAMASIIDDGMLGDLSSSMTVDPENFKEQKPEVIDLIINSMKDVANKSYSEKQSKSKLENQGKGFELKNIQTGKVVLDDGYYDIGYGPGGEAYYRKTEDPSSQWVKGSEIEVKPSQDQKQTTNTTAPEIDETIMDSIKEENPIKDGEDNKAYAARIVKIYNDTVNLN
jgi:flagellar biosynthesis chaperone FliJ